MNRNVLLLLVLFLFSCGNAKLDNKRTAPDKPTVAEIKKTIILPKELKEISGISFVHDSLVVAVQDETGIMYFFDLAKESIVRALPFAEPGDYEDIAVVGNTVYVVNSSGTIFQVDNFLSRPSRIISHNTELTEKNNIEALAWDKKNKRLLLGAKDDGLTNEKDKEIFAFDLTRKRLNIEPAYVVRIREIEAFYKGDELEEASKKFLKAFGNTKLNQVFRTSAMAFHPTTGDLYVLTSLNNMIAVLSPSTGDIKRIIELKGPDFNQPEGLAFTTDARLYVSNESNGKRANIIEIDYE